MVDIKPQNSPLPKGAIILWSGAIADIPDGFALCNGSNGTPDLRNSFVVGADADVSGEAKSTYETVSKQSGGSKTHTHSFTTGNQSGSSDRFSTGSGGDPDITYDPHTHSGTTNANATTTAPVVWFALAYIQKL